MTLQKKKAYFLWIDFSPNTRAINRHGISQKFCDLIDWKTMSASEDAYHLWALLGRRELHENWEWLQVASSNHIAAEIKRDLGMMCGSAPYLRKWKGALHSQEFCCFETAKSQIYHYVYQKYKRFRILIVDDATLLQKYGVKLPENGFDPLRYAEVLLAYQTKARMWHPAPKANEHETLNEREMLKEIRKFLNHKENP